MTPTRLRLLVLGALLGAAGGFASDAAAQFEYTPPGVLVDGSGEGRVDETAYVPGMRFPIELAPAFANSQVWGNGGAQGGGGSQCDAANYSYPWWDNYCESRSWTMPLCPAGTGHQGQDIRPSSCDDDTHYAVAVDDGVISNIGSYSVSLTTADGTIHRYLHMANSSLLVSVGNNVTRGQRLGRISNEFGGTPTTIHLHYDISMDVESVGFAYVPTYLSLVRAYEDLLGTPGSTCGLVAAQGQHIIDNRSSCFELHGPPATWRYVDDAGYDGDLYWSYVWENAESNWAEWVFEVARGGEYEVEVYVTPAYAQAQDARYTVRAGATPQEVRVNQSQGDGWLSIGFFDFEAGMTQHVAVYDGPGEALDLQRQFIADAIRVTPTFTLDSPPEPTEPDLGGPDMGQDQGHQPDLGGSDPAPDTGGTPDQGTPDQGRTDAPSGADTSSEAFEVTVNQGCGCAAASPDPREAGWAVLPLAAVVAVCRRRRRRAATR